MGSSRRDRAKKESSFLEDVKATLSSLLLEVADIKLLLSQSNMVASVDLPPPAPPRLDIINRDLFLQCRPRSSTLSHGIAFDSLPKLWQRVAPERDEITDFLEAQGHFNVDSDEILVTNFAVQGKDAGELSTGDSNSALRATIQYAQQLGGEYRQAEQEGIRTTYEAMKADSAHGGPEVPTTLSNETLGDFFLGHLDIACSKFSNENRRPYLQLQVRKLENRHVLSEEAWKLILEIMDKYAPSADVSEELKYMCSHCGALYSMHGTRCSVCYGLDIFDASGAVEEGSLVSDSDAPKAEDIDYSVEEQMDNRAIHITSPCFPSFMTCSNDDHLKRSANSLGEVARLSSVSNEPGPPIEADRSVAKSFFAIRGPTPGVYDSWEEAKMNSGGVGSCKKFTDRYEALAFADLACPEL